MAEVRNFKVDFKKSKNKSFVKLIGLFFLQPSRIYIYSSIYYYVFNLIFFSGVQR